MGDTYVILIKLMERASLLVICLFIITRIQGFRNVFLEDNYKRKDIIIITVMFSAFAIAGTYTGLKVDGSLVNVRIVTIISGGILFGPFVGIAAGVVSGLHRYLIDINGVTSLPCLISSITAGVIAGFINTKVKKNYKWIIGIVTGMICEVLTMFLILLFSRLYSIGLEIVSKIAIPMILGEVNVELIVFLVQNLEDEKEMIAAKQAKLALDIANKTLPYFREINSNSLRKICTIIKNDIKADAVSITDNKYILVYIGIGEEYYNIGNNILNYTAKEAIASGKIIIKDDHIDSRSPKIIRLDSIMFIHD